MKEVLSAGSGAAQPRKIELILWDGCNAGCIFCTSGNSHGPAFDFDSASDELMKYRRLGVEHVDFGGGEPTIWPEFVRLARAASDMGYTSIGVKSNGIRFCYPEFVLECMRAGVSRFSISVWGHDPAEHDRMAGRSGAFEMTEMGLKHLTHYDADVSVDFLMTAENAPFMPRALAKLNRAGVRKFSVWTFCVFGAGGVGLDIVPRLFPAGEIFQEAAALLDGKADISTSHIPPCLLGPAVGSYFNVSALSLLIVMPGGRSFPAEASPFETGLKKDPCGACMFDRVCAGPRKEYVEAFGFDEFQPVV